MSLSMERRRLVSSALGVCILIISCLSLLEGVFSQTCVSTSLHLLHFDKDDMCRYYPDSINLELIYMTNVTVNTTESVIRKELNALAHAVRKTSENFKVAPETCRRAALAVLCSGSYLQCTTLNMSGIIVPIPIPRPPCHYTCTRMVDACRSFLEENGAEVPDCDAINNATGLQTFPEEGWVINSIPVPCFNATEERIPHHFKCPAPLIFDGSKETRCNLPCPNPLYSDKEQRDLMDTLGVLGVISIGCLFFVMISYGLNPRTRKWPGVCICYLSFVLILFEIGKAYGFAPIDAICNGPTDNGDRTNSYCLSVSFFNHVAGMIACGWATVITLNLFLLLAFDYRLGWPGIITVILLTHLYPFTSWFAAVGTNKIQGQLLTCSVQSSDIWVQIGLQDIPLLIATGVTIIMMIPSFYLIIKSKAQAGESTSKGKKWISSVRVFIYVTYYAVNILLFQCVALYQAGLTDEMEAGVKKWVVCEIAMEENCEERYKVRVPLGLLYATFVMQSVSGIKLLLCFGTTDEVINWWKQIFHGQLPITKISTTKSLNKTTSQKNTNSASKL